MYAWGTDHVSTLGARDTFIAFCQAKGVNTLFVDMYGTLGSSNYSAPNVAAMQDLVGRFKALGSSQKVYAMAGDITWSDEANNPGVQAWVATNIVGNIVSYNAESGAAQQFDGFHYDVEYWLGAQDTAEALAGLQVLVDDAQSRLGHCGLFAAFHLTDGTATRPSLLYNGKTQQDGLHLLDMADHVVVGTYRDTAAFNAIDGVEGVIGLLQPWYDYASSNTRAVYAAVETNSNVVDYVTFFGQTNAEMEAEIALVNEAFQGSAYEGLVVHDYVGWSALT